MESMYSKYMDGMGAGLGSVVNPVSEADNKFSIKVADCTISNKVNVKAQKPCLSYFDVTLNKDTEIAFFSYLVFQNFYTNTVSIKQFIPSSGSASAASKEDLKNDKNWVTILKNYRLMANAHFENDAQNYHIIGIELVSRLSYC